MYTDTFYLHQVTRDSLAKVAGLQDRLTEAHEKHVKASQRLKELEGERKRTVYAQQQAEVRAGPGSGLQLPVITPKERVGMLPPLSRPNCGHWVL